MPNVLNQLSDRLSFTSNFTLSQKISAPMQATRTLLIALMSFVFLSTSFNSVAIEVEGLYQVELQVEDQTPANRWRAALTGLKEVLVRKSGSRAILDSHEVQQAYGKVTRYIQRFEYSKNDLATSTSQTVSNATNNPALNYTLSISFDSRLVDELIQSAGMPIWGSNRPLTILWLAVEQDFKRQIIKEQPLNSEEFDQDSTTATNQASSEDPQELIQQRFVEQIEHNAIRRGIPILLPLMDIDDQSIVSLSDVWGRFNQPVEMASKRYGADTLISGRVSQNGNYWQAKLTYISNEDRQPIEISSLNIEQLIADLTDKLAEILCQKYCVVEMAQPHQLSLQVSNVTDYSDLKQLQKYLESLSSIRKVTIDKVLTPNLLLNISLLGDIESVKEALRLGNRLLEDTSPDINLFKQIPAVDDSFDALDSDRVNQSDNQSDNQTNAQSSNQSLDQSSQASHQTIDETINETDYIANNPQSDSTLHAESEQVASTNALINANANKTDALLNQDGQLELQNKINQTLYYRWTR